MGNPEEFRLPLGVNWPENQPCDMPRSILIFLRKTVRA